MKTAKFAVLALCVMGLLIGFCAQALAGAGPAEGDPPCCLVVNPGTGALSMKGTMALVYTPGQVPNLDVTLRLERSGVQHIFRLNIQGVNLKGMLDEYIVCLILNPRETGSPDVQEKVTFFVNSILSAFFTGLDPSDTKLVITRGSISSPQGVLACSDENADPVYCLIPETTRVSSMGDITIHAVSADKARYENTACPLY
jgi:hypothetical protein